MNKKDLIDAIVIITIFIVLVIANAMLDTKCYEQKQKINVLENTVEQQIELIDAIQQNY